MGKREDPENVPITPSVQTFLAAASAAAGSENPSQGNKTMENQNIKSQNQIAGAHELMVPLQVRMKHVKQKIPPKESRGINDEESDSADEKVRKWLSEGEKFQQEEVAPRIMAVKIR